MSEEQLTALLAKLKDDARLQEKLKGAADLDAFVALAQEAGFDVSKADWHKYQATQTLELSDEQLESVAGGKGGGPTAGERGSGGDQRRCGAVG
jgi:predicted ribosomally synthesized peptide with nif11-like leader